MTWFEVFISCAFMLALVTVVDLSGRVGNHSERALGLALAHVPMLVVLVWMRRRLPWAPPRDPQERRLWLRKRRRRAKGEATNYRLFLYVSLGSYGLGLLIGWGLMWYRGP